MTDRNLTSASKTYLGEKKAITYSLLRMDFSVPLFYTDAPHSIDYNGDTYVSSGVLLEIPEIVESLSIKPNTLSIKFSGVSAAVHALTNENYKHVEIKIYRKIMAPVPQVIHLYTGFLDNYSTVEDSRKGTTDIKWSVINHWSNLDKTVGRFISHEYQQTLHPGDDGFKYLSVTGPVADYWGKRAYSKLSMSWTKPEAVKGTTVKQHIANPWFWITVYDWYYDWDALAAANTRLPVAYGETPIKGTPVFRGLSGTTNEFLWVVYALCEGEIDSVVSASIEGEDITSANLAPYVTMTVYTGTLTQGNDFNLRAAVSEWTASCTLKGVAYVIMKYKFSKDTFDSEPEPEFIIKAKKLYDPRTGATVWSENNVLVLLDYMSDDVYGNSIPQAVIDNAEVSANICDQQKTNHSGTGPALISRYGFNGIIDTNKKLRNNVDLMLMSMFAHIPWVGGTYKIRLEAEVVSPVYDFDGDTITGKVQIEDGGSKAYANRIVFSYTDKLAAYASESVVIESATFLAEDNNVVLEQTMGNPFETDVYRAKNLANTGIKKSRQQITARLTSFKADALQIETGDLVTFTRQVKNWVNKLFVVTEMKIDRHNNIKFRLSEFDFAVYDWAIQAERAAAPPPSLANPFFVAPVALLTLNSGSAHLLTQADGTVVSRIFGDFIKATDAYVERYEVFAKKTTETDYLLRATINETDASEFYITPVEDGATYDVRVYSVNSLGRRSVPVDKTHLVVGKDQDPVAPTSIGVGSIDINVVNLFWGVSPDLDFAAMEVWTNTVNNRATASLRVTQPGTTFNHATSVPTYYWVRAVDTSGLKSTFFPVSSTDGKLGTPDGLTTDAVWDDIIGKPANSEIYNLSFINGFENDDFSFWTVSPGNTLAQNADNFSGAFSGLFTSTDATGNPSGTTDKTYIIIPEETALAFAGRRIKITAFIKQSASPATVIGFSYSNNDGADSGWKYAAPTAAYTAFSFFYDVPAPVVGGPDYIGIWGDVFGNGDGVLIDNVVIETIYPEADWSLMNDDNGLLPADGADVTADQTAGTSVNITPMKYSWFENMTTVPPVSTASNVVIDTNSGYFGSKSLRIEAAAADAWVFFGATQTDFNIPITPNKKWIVSAYVRFFNVNSPTGDLQIYAKTSDLNFHQLDFNIPADSNYHRVSGVIDLSANESTQMMLRFDNDSYSGAGSVFMYIDGIMVEEQVGNLTTPGAYTLPASVLTLPQTEWSNADQAWADISGAGLPEDNSTAGATWGSNITSQPADSELLNSLQDWLGVSGDGIPDSFYERGIVIHNWFNTAHNWLTTQGVVLSTGMVMTATTSQGAFARMMFQLSPKWTWDVGRFFSVSFTITNATNHSTSSYTYLTIGGLGSSTNFGIAFKKVGSTLTLYGYKAVAGVTVFTQVLGVTFTDGDNMRVEAWRDPISIYRTHYAVYKNGVKYTATSFSLGTYLHGNSAASTVPNFLTNPSTGGNFIITVSDYYFHQLEA